MLTYFEIGQLLAMINEKMYEGAEVVPNGRVATEEKQREYGTLYTKVRRMMAAANDDYVSRLYEDGIDPSLSGSRTAFMTFQEMGPTNLETTRPHSWEDMRNARKDGMIYAGRCGIIPLPETQSASIELGTNPGPA